MSEPVGESAVGAQIGRLTMPKWGLSMTEGRLISWLVEEGDQISEGQEVAEVETNKLDGAVESPLAGVLRRRVAQPGDIVPVGGLLGVLAAPSVSDEELERFVAKFQDSFASTGEVEDTGPVAQSVELAVGPVRYLRQGEGAEAIVLLHGFGGDLNNWMFLAPGLAGKRTVYALDLPGHGGSTKRLQAPALATLRRTVKEFVESQGLESAHLVGHSLGGLVAARTAIEHPSLARSLTLIAPAGLGEEINGEFLDRFVAASSRRELRGALELLFADPGQVSRQLIDEVLAYKRIDGVSVALSALADELQRDGRQHESVTAELDSLATPLLVIWGAEDRIIPAEQIRAAPARAKTHVLQGVGHSPHLEAPTEVRGLLEEFLQDAVT